MVHLHNGILQRSDKSENRITDINVDIFQTHVDLKNCEGYSERGDRMLLSTRRVTVCEMRDVPSEGRVPKHAREREGPVNGWWWEGGSEDPGTSFKDISRFY